VPRNTSEFTSRTSPAAGPSNGGCVITVPSGLVTVIETCLENARMVSVRPAA
jgi:hypothetical protein